MYYVTLIVRTARKLVLRSGERARLFSHLERLMRVHENVQHLLIVGSPYYPLFQYPVRVFVWYADTMARLRRPATFLALFVFLFSFCTLYASVR